MFYRLSDSDIPIVLDHRNELYKRVYEVPKAKLLLKGKRVTYKELIEANLYPELKISINILIDKIKKNDLMDKIFELIDSIPLELCSHIRKQFYKTIIYLRYNCLIANIDFDRAHTKLREVLV